MTVIRNVYNNWISFNQWISSFFARTSVPFPHSIKRRPLYLKVNKHCATYFCSETILQFALKFFCHFMYYPIPRFVSVFVTHSFLAVPVPQLRWLNSCKERLCNGGNFVWDGRKFCSLIGEVKRRGTWLRIGATWTQINAPNETIEISSEKCERNELMWTGLSWHWTEPTRVMLIN